MSKTLNTRIQYKYDSPENWANCDKPSLAGELYVHGPLSAEDEDQSIKLSIGDGMRQIKDLPALGGGVNKPELIPVAKPYITQPNLTYTGEWISIADHVVGLDTDKMYVGSAQEQQVGNYELYLELHKEYCWEDKTTDPIYLSWSIVKGKDTITTSETDITMTYTGTSAQQYGVYLIGKELDTATIVSTIFTPQSVVEIFEDYVPDQGLIIFDIVSGYTPTETTNVKAEITMRRTNYQDETISFNITVEPGVVSYTWKVYETTQTLSQNTTGYRKLDVYDTYRDTYSTTYWLVKGYDDNGTYYEVVTDTPDAYPNQLDRTVDHEVISYSEYKKNNKIKTIIDTYPNGMYTDGLATESDGKTYYYETVGFVLFNKSTYVDDVTSQDISDYPDKDVQYSEEDDKWYYYELQE